MIIQGGMSLMQVSRDIGVNENLFHKWKKHYLSDSQYTNGIVQSNSSTGNSYDNAVTESFFHTLKTELTYWEKYQTREEAKKSIFEYIEINYNRRRLHSSLGYLSLLDFEERNRKELIEKVV